MQKLSLAWVYIAKLELASTNNSNIMILYTHVHQDIQWYLTPQIENCNIMSPFHTSAPCTCSAEITFIYCHKYVLSDILLWDSRWWTITMCSWRNSSMLDLVKSYFFHGFFQFHCSLTRWVNSRNNYLRIILNFVLYSYN